MPIIGKLLSFYYQTRVRGSYRLTDFLAARIDSLKEFPVRTEGGVIYLDLRISSARGILSNPRFITGEDVVMRRFVEQGDVVFDVGCHFGFYTLLLSSLVGTSGRVFAFEPNHELYHSLECTFSGIPNVELLKTALSDKAAKGSLYVPADASMASLCDWTDEPANKTHHIPCQVNVLDALMSDRGMPRPSFVKCDVEGAELSVFRGALGVLDQVDAPAVLFEANGSAAKSFGVMTQEYVSFFKSLPKPNYEVFEVLNDGIRPIESSNVDYANLLAVPRSRMNKLAQVIS